MSAVGFVRQGHSWSGVIVNPGQNSFLGEEQFLTQLDVGKIMKMDEVLENVVTVAGFADGWDAKILFDFELFIGVHCSKSVMMS